MQTMVWHKKLKRAFRLRYGQLPPNVPLVQAEAKLDEGVQKEDCELCKTMSVHSGAPCLHPYFKREDLEALP